MESQPVFWEETCSPQLSKRGESERGCFGLDAPKPRLFVVFAFRVSSGLL